MDSILEEGCRLGELKINLVLTLASKVLGYTCKVIVFQTTVDIAVLIHSSAVRMLRDKMPHLHMTRDMAV